MASEVITVGLRQQLERGDMRAIGRCSGVVIWKGGLSVQKESEQSMMDLVDQTHRRVRLKALKHHLDLFR